MVYFRIASNEWNLKQLPWRGAVGIEDVTDPGLAVPPVVAWFARGNDPSLIEAFIKSLNEAWAFKRL